MSCGIKRQQQQQRQREKQQREDKRIQPEPGPKVVSIRVTQSSPEMPLQICCLFMLYVGQHKY